MIENMNEAILGPGRDPIPGRAHNADSWFERHSDLNLDSNFGQNVLAGLLDAAKIGGHYLFLPSSVEQGIEPQPEKPGADVVSPTDHCQAEVRQPLIAGRKVRRYEVRPRAFDEGQRLTPEPVPGGVVTM